MNATQPSLITIVLAVIVFLDSSSSQGQTVSLELGPAEPLPQQLFTFNTDMATAIMFRGVGYDSPQFEDAVRQLRPQGLRFPGGTLANNYLWSKDSFSQPTNDKTGWAAEHLQLFRKIGRPYDLPGFARVTKRNDVTPIWVLNVYEETPDSVLALFKRLDSLGLKVTAVEMANEPYWDGRSLADVKRYIAASRPLADALRKHRPDVKIGACFAPFGNSANYEVIWNAPLAKETWFDAVVFHEYYGGQGFALEKGEKVSMKALLHPEAMIEEPVAKLRKLMPDKPIWFTEWNIGMEGLSQWKNTGAELQYIAASFASLVEHRDAIEMACFHAFYDSRFGAFYIDDTTGQIETNASYELFRLLGTTFADAESLRPIESPSDDLRGFATLRREPTALAAGMRTGAPTGTIPDASAFGSQSPFDSGDVRLFLLNRGDTPRTITLPLAMKGELAHAIIDGTPNRKLEISTKLTEINPVNAASVTLPAYSINLIAPRATLEFQPKTTDDDNLFPRRPDLLFWYPPYASEQPRFDADGVYAVDLSKCKGKSLAVVKMNLASSKLKSGSEYVVEFEAKLSLDGGLIVKLPQAHSEDGEYCLLSANYATQRFTFTFDADSNDGEVAIVFTEDVIARGPTASLREFRIHQP